MQRLINSYMKRTISYKVSNGCNLACTYCYERRRVGGLLRDCTDSAVSIVEKIEELARRPGKLSLMICLHGGEPLLMGVSAYDALCRRIRKINELPGKRIALSIQTNGTLITDEWADCFYQHRDLFNGNGIGISLDGDAIAQNNFRKTSSGGNSYEMVLNGVKALKVRRLSFGLLAVVTRPSLGRSVDILDSMSELDPVLIKFVPCHDFMHNGTLTTYSITPVEFARYMLDVFRHWIKSGMIREQVIIEPIFSALMNISGKFTPWCEFSENKCDDFLLVDSSGKMGVCDNLPTYDNVPSLKEKSLEDLLSFTPHEYTEFRAIAFRECASCPVKLECKGGCLGTRHNFYTKAAPELKGEYCNGKRHFFNELKSVMSRANTEK